MKMLKEAFISGNFKESVGNVQAAAHPVSAANLRPVLINRDLSLIEFFWRVLEEAFDDTHPLLERAKFVSIFSTIVDEFFMIRIPCLQERAGCVVGVSPDGLTPAEQLVKIRERILELVELQYKVIQDELIPALAGEDVVLTQYTSLSGGERQALVKYFKEKIYPILTPQAVDPSHPFPYISGGSLNLGAMVKPSLNPRVERALQHSDEELFVRLLLYCYH